MSLNMFLNSAESQTKTMNQVCIDIIQAMEEVKKSIDIFLFDARLQGKTYATAKSYMVQVYRPLAQGIIYLCEELIRQNDRYPNQFRSQVSSSDIVEQEILDQIDEIDRQISILKSNGVIFGPNIHIFEMIKKALEEKLERIYEYNTVTSSNYNTAMELAQVIAQGLSQIKDGKGFNPITKTFSVDGMELSWVQKIDKIHYTRKAKELYGDHLENYPEDLEKIIAIIKFEEVNKKYIDQTNKFLDPLVLKDQIEIKFLIYTADEPFRTLAMKYLDRFKIESLNESGVFSPSENIIKINIIEDRNNPRGSYYTFFHEIAHAIDYYAGIDYGFEGYFSDTFAVDGKTLNNYIYDDVRNHFIKEINQLLQSEKYLHLKIEERMRVINHVTENLMNQNKDFNKLTKLERELVNELRQIYRNRLWGPENNVASDIYGGVTNNVITGQYGHKSSYWFDGNVRIREPNREAFAEYFGRIMVPDGESRDKGIESIGEYLPKSKSFIEDLFVEIRKVR